ALNDIGKTLRVVGIEVEGSVVPDFAQRRNVVGDKHTAGERGLQRRESEGLVTRGGGVHGSAAEQLRVLLRSAEGNASPRRSCRGGAAHHLIGMLVGAGDADGDLMVVLQQERN